MPAEGRSLSFHLAAAHPVTITPDTLTVSSRTSVPTTALGGSAAGPPGGDGGSGAQRGPQHDSFAAGQPRRAAATTDLDDAPPPTVRWLRTAIDITA